MRRFCAAVFQNEILFAALRSAAADVKPGAPHRIGLLISEQNLVPKPTATQAVESCILTCEKQLFTFFLIFPFSPDEFIDNRIDNRSITKNSPKHSRADRGPVHPCHSHRLILRTKTFFRSRACSLQTSSICNRPCKKIHTAQRLLVTTAVHRLLPHQAFLQNEIVRKHKAQSSSWHGPALKPQIEHTFDQMIQRDEMKLQKQRLREKRKRQDNLLHSDRDLPV